MMPINEPQIRHCCAITREGLLINQECQHCNLKGCFKEGSVTVKQFGDFLLACTVKKSGSVGISLGLIPGSAN